MVGLRHRMARHFVPGIEENGKLPQHALNFGTETSKNVESKKKHEFWAKIEFSGVFGLSETPPPPLWKIKGSFDQFTSFLGVFSRKNHHRHGHAWMGLVSVTGNVAKLKIMKAAKKPIQKYNSYF